LVPSSGKYNKATEDQGKGISVSWHPLTDPYVGVFLCQVIDLYCQVKQLSHPYNYPVNNETEIEMTEARFKVIERSSVEKVIEVAVKLIEKGYKPVAEIMKMPNTGLFTQVMHWEPLYRTPNRKR
jgi:hypothetical protein